jgi:DNA/RNA-binding domain of Phe-tRNA-synthetase-like protein
MKSTMIAINNALLARHPNLTVAAFAVSGLGTAAAALAKQRDLFDGVATALKECGLSQQNLTEDPRIKGWRTAIAACGLKASTYKGSAEQLVKRTMTDGGVKTPLPVVTAYCAESAKHVAPMGAYDISRLPGDRIELRLAVPGADAFTPLGGRAEDMPLTDKVAVYAIGSTVICYAYNHRDSRETCLVSASDDAIFVGEAVEPVHLAPLRAAMSGIRALLTAHGAISGPIVECSLKAPEVSIPAATALAPTT